MKTVWQCVEKFGRKRNREGQLCYLGYLLGKFEDPRIGRIAARVVSGRRLLADYEIGEPGYTPRVGHMKRLPKYLPASRPTNREADRQEADRETAPLLEGLTFRERLIVRMMFGIGCEQLTQVQIARKLGCSRMTLWNTLRRVRVKVLVS